MRYIVKCEVPAPSLTHGKHPLRLLGAKYKDVLATSFFHMSKAVS